MGGILSLFSKPKVPSPAPAKPAPTVDDAQLRIEDARRQRARKGRASTRLVDSDAAPSTAARALTGN